MLFVDEHDEIHLEKHPSPSALTADRTTVSESLVPLASISLENADLYSELQRKRAEDDCVRSDTEPRANIRAERRGGGARIAPFHIGSSHQEAEYSQEPIQAWLVVKRIRPGFIREWMRKF
jgi:hypothetical protein